VSLKLKGKLLKFQRVKYKVEALKHMGERRTGERGRSDDREVLDGVISETRAVMHAVVLTISHKTVLLISMEELR